MDSTATQDPFAFVVEGASDTAVDSPAPCSRIREGSPQQEAFWENLILGSGHVLLEARAGTGKSSSCREGMWRLLDVDPQLNLRYCCFNKKIADEFREKCPPGVEVGTMHSFGLRALSRSLGSQIDTNKTYLVLDSLDGGPDLPRWLRKAVATVVSLAKNHALHPDRTDLDKQLDYLIWNFDVETYRQLNRIVGLAIDVLKKSATSLNVADFDDMLWLPVLMELDFPSVDFLFIDEVQDLNPVQHALVPLMCPSGRTVIVGDPYQSIYAFRGADSESIPKLKAQLDAETLPLTVTWRCPRSHVELAKQLVPDFDAAPEAAEGIVEHADETVIDQCSAGDMVLCRANAPIISACLRMVRQHRRAIVRGRALGDQLKTIVRKLDASTVAQLVRAIQVWRAKEIERLERKDGTDHLIEQVEDKAACLEAIAETCGSPAEVPGVIDNLFADDIASNRVTFSSVHRAKGSEARNVAYIQIPFSEARDRRRPPQPWELDQRRNLRYVALTRSMERLTLVTPRGR